MIQAVYLNNLQVYTAPVRYNTSRKNTKNKIHQMTRGVFKCSLKRSYHTHKLDKYKALMFYQHKIYCAGERSSFIFYLFLMLFSLHFIMETDDEREKYENKNQCQCQKLTGTNRPHFLWQPLIFTLLHCSLTVFQRNLTKSCYSLVYWGKYCVFCATASYRTSSTVCTNYWWCW